MFKRIVLCLCLGVAISLSSLSSVAGDLLAEWKLVKDKKNVQVYMRHTEQTRSKSFKGILVFQPGEPFSAIAALLDFDHNHQTFHFVSDIEELERVNDFTRIARVHTLMPWPIKDREAVAKIQVVQDPDTKSIVATIEQTDIDVPVLPGYVRVPEFRGLLGLELVGDQGIKMTYEFLLDPGGNVPLWLADVVLKDTPYYTLQRLRRFVDKPEYQVQRFDFIDYPENY